MGICSHCSKGSGITLLIVGILFLLRDWSVWNFFNIGGWTALFIILGMMLWGSSCCSECQMMSSSAKSSKKK